MEELTMVKESTMESPDRFSMAGSGRMALKAAFTLDLADLWELSCTSRPVMLIVWFCCRYSEPQREKDNVTRIHFTSGRNSRETDKRKITFAKQERERERNTTQNTFAKQERKRRIHQNAFAKQEKN